MIYGASDSESEAESESLRLRQAHQRQQQQRQQQLPSGSSSNAHSGSFAKTFSDLIISSHGRAFVFDSPHLRCDSLFDVVGSDRNGCEASLSPPHRPSTAAVSAVSASSNVSAGALAHNTRSRTVADSSAEDFCQTEEELEDLLDPLGLFPPAELALDPDPELSARVQQWVISAQNGRFGHPERSL